MNLKTKVKILAPLKKSFIGHFFRFAKGLKTYRHELVKKRLAEKTPQERRKDIRRMLLFCYKNFFTPYEYYLLGIDKKTDEEALTYISDCMKDDYCFRLNDPGNKIIFDDKMLTFQKFRKYYKRDMIKYVPGSTECDKNMAGFIEKNRRFIVKPSNAGRGKGIAIFECANADEIPSFMRKLQLQYPHGFIAEELIVQSKEIAVFHPASLNTVRMPTMKIGNEVRIFHPWFRCGQGNAIIDNASAGGIASLINPENGIIIASGDELGNAFELHPDTKIAFKGFSIPRWREAIDLVKELSWVVPNTNYIAWDIALTDKGWVIVEGNAHGQFLQQQMLMDKGLKPEVDLICKKLSI